MNPFFSPNLPKILYNKIITQNTIIYKSLSKLFSFLTTILKKRIKYLHISLFTNLFFNNIDNKK